MDSDDNEDRRDSNEDEETGPAEVGAPAVTERGEEIHRERIFVGNLAGLPEDIIKEAFEKFGEIHEFRIVVSRRKPKEGESEAMKKKRASFKARHRKNIAKGKMSAAYWANKVKW